tara:strand:- start:5657 stop:5782 length:126 start_codon:yes stop_codon:yes gene_type:complete
MEALTGEVIVVLVAILGLGSSVIHYSAFAQSRVTYKKEKID